MKVGYWVRKNYAHSRSRRRGGFGKRLNIPSPPPYASKLKGRSLFSATGSIFDEGGRLVLEISRRSREQIDLVFAAGQDVKMYDNTIPNSFFIYDEEAASTESDL